jgi:hypothetical protein
VRAKNTVDITYVARAERTGPRCGRCTWHEKIDAGRSANGDVPSSGLDGRGTGRVEAPTGRARRRDASAPRGCCCRTAARSRSLARARHAVFSGDGDALAIAFDPTAPTSRAPATTTGR